MEVAVPDAGNAQAVIVAVPFVAVEDDAEKMELQRSLEALQGKYNDLLTNQRKLVNQNAAILAGLECPVCLGYFADKRVIMCGNGHNVCEGCNNGLVQCPVGRCQHGASRNLFVEMAGNVTLRPCKYTEEGCFALYTLLAAGERELHEGSCPRRFQCRMFLADNEDDELAYCQWRGKRDEFSAHCIEQHPVINASEATVNVPIPVASARNDIEITFPYRCHNEKLFLLSFHYRRDADARTLVPVAMFMGKQEDLDKFKVSVSFVTPDKQYEVGFVGFPCEPVREDFATAVAKHPHLDKSMLKIFTRTNTIECAVRISSVE